MPFKVSWPDPCLFLIDRFFGAKKTRSCRKHQAPAVRIQAYDETTKSESMVMNFTKNIGMLLLSIYLILAGILGLGVFTLGSLHVIVALLALIAGIFILIGK